MAWQDTLREASFRGVPFLYKSVDSAIGRRTVVYEFPGRDDVEVEDLGARADRFSIEAYVLGPDYQTARDRLRTAFKTAGPGQLVHPYWGSVKVSVEGDVRIRETTAEGGMARFNLSVVAVGEIKPSSDTQVDTGAKVDVAADAANESARAVFVPSTVNTGSSYGFADLIEASIDNAASAMNEGLIALRSVKGNVNAALSLVDSGLAAIDSAVAGIDSLIRLPGDLYDSVTGTVQQVFASISSLEDSVADLLSTGADKSLPYSRGAASQTFRSQILMAAWRTMDAFDANGVVVQGTGTQGSQESQNLAAIIRMYRVVSTIEATRSATELTFDSFDRAFEVLEELTEALDDLAASATDDQEYQKLADLRSAFALHIQSTAGNLPRIVDYTPSVTLPALVIAQTLYGDATRDAEIIDRNSTKTPFAIPGGVTLEVLAND